MIFQEPTLEAADLAVIKLIDDQKERMRSFSQNAPRRWIGSLRRLSFAKAMQGSNSIEGYDATLENAVAVVDNEPPLDPRDATTLALFGYRDALTYIMQTARDPYFELNKQFLKSLQFMMINYDMSKNPGQYRPGSIQVISDRTGDVVYVAPDVELIDPLVTELVDYLQSSSSKGPALVRAAMAHLNLTMIHPFSDGNGRMSRALQTFVLAREGVIDSVFASIEEWLGANTEQYYSILAEVGQGQWNPSNNALPWVRFCLRAHYQQAGTTLRRYDEYGKLYSEVEALGKNNGLQLRMILPLFDAALGLSLTNSRYVTVAEVEPHSATRDLKLLVEKGLLVPHGEKRGRVYRASPELINLRSKVRGIRKTPDPYDLVQRDLQGPRLPGL